MSDERMRFVAAYDRREQSMAELCRRYGISRKTGYKWVQRWLSEGPAALEDRSRAPHGHPNQVPPEQVTAILKVRDRWGWGARKLRVLLQREWPDIAWPVASTIHQILSDHGRVLPPKKRRRVPPQSEPLSHCQASNTVWCCDFKGDFSTDDGRRCYPLTITDAFSRYLLCCQGLETTRHDGVRPIFEMTFRQFGLPDAIRSDNGVPFASLAIGGLSRLSVWWIKLGIRTERIEPGKPQQNGRHERMHLTLKQETATPPASTFRKQQARFDVFREVFNEIRPHEALAMQTPASVYVPSVREYPRREPEIDYPADWRRRRVQRHGDIQWDSDRLFISEVLHDEWVGLEPVDGRYWRLYFGDVWLGVLDGHTRTLLTKRQLGRHPELKPNRPQDRPSATLHDDPAMG